MDAFISAAALLTIFEKRREELKEQLASGKEVARYGELCGQIKGLRQASEDVREEVRRLAQQGGDSYPVRAAARGRRTA